MKHYLELALTVALLGSFFAPWSKFFALKGSGLALATNPEIQGAGLFVVPILTALFLIFKLIKKDRVRWLQILTGLLPVVAFTAALIYIGQKTETNAVEAFSNFKAFLDWGVYLALISGFLLFFCALFRSKHSNV